MVDDVVAPVVSTVVTPVVTEVVAPVTDPVLAPVTEIVAPVTEAVAPVVGDVLDIVEPVTAPVLGAVTPITDGLVAPVAEALAPIGDSVGGLLEPIAPVVDPLTPILTPFQPVVGQVPGVVGGVIDPLIPVVDGAVDPFPGVQAPLPASPAPGTGAATVPPVASLPQRPDAAGDPAAVLGDTIPPGAGLLRGSAPDGVASLRDRQADAAPAAPSLDVMPEAAASHAAPVDAMTPVPAADATDAFAGAVGFGTASSGTGTAVASSTSPLLARDAALLGGVALAAAVLLGLARLSNDRLPTGPVLRIPVSPA